NISSPSFQRSMPSTLAAFPALMSPWRSKDNTNASYASCMAACVCSAGISGSGTVKLTSIAIAISFELHSITKLSERATGGLFERRGAGEVEESLVEGFGGALLAV